MSGVRYFYTDALAAAWMKERHGVRFIRTDLMNWWVRPRVAETLEQAVLDGRYYVHPESLPMLKPMPGDFGARRRDLYEYKYGSWECGNGYATLNDDLAHQVTIIQRNGKPFHHPEQEAA